VIKSLTHQLSLEFRISFCLFQKRWTWCRSQLVWSVILMMVCNTVVACSSSGRSKQWQPLTSAMTLPANAHTPMTPQAQLNLKDVGTPPDPAKSVSLATPFIGCWQGKIAKADSIESIGLFSITLPTQGYRFCYTQDANAHTSKMEFREVIVNGEEIVPTEFESQVVWSSADVAYLRTHTASNTTQWLLFIPISYRQEVYADETVTLENPDLLGMRGVELIKVNGSDYARAAFHANFHRVPKP
jgi:hypothetical protein